MHVFLSWKWLCRVRMQLLVFAMQPQFFECSWLSPEAILKISRVVISVKPECLPWFCVFMREKLVEIKNFTGCLMAGVYRDITDEFTFLVYAEWDTIENFIAYQHSSLFKAETEKVLPWLIAKPDSAHFLVKPR